jgi:hypothetical protein
MFHALNRVRKVTMIRALTTESLPDDKPAQDRIRDEIEQLRRDLEARQTVQRPAPGCVVRAYQELMDRQFKRLDDLDESPKRRSINIP